MEFLSDQTVQRVLAEAQLDIDFRIEALEDKIQRLQNQLAELRPRLTVEDIKSRLELRYGGDIEAAQALEATGCPRAALERHGLRECQFLNFCLNNDYRKGLDWCVKNMSLPDIRRELCVAIMNHLKWKDPAAQYLIKAAEVKFDDEFREAPHLFAFVRFSGDQLEKFYEGFP